MITQKKMGTEISFDFTDDGVKYAMKDKNHSESLTIPYEDITKNTSTFEERNSWFRNVAIYLGILGGISLIYNIVHTNITVPIWLILAGVFFLMYKYMRVEYTVIDCANARMYVIKDSLHEQVIKTIHAWRCEKLANKYGTINWHNDPNSELQKFAWLKAQEVITAEDYERFRVEIITKYSGQQGGPGYPSQGAGSPDP